MTTVIRMATTIAPAIAAPMIVVRPPLEGGLGGTSEVVLIILPAGLVVADVASVFCLSIGGEVAPAVHATIHII